MASNHTHQCGGSCGGTFTAEEAVEFQFCPTCQSGVWIVTADEARKEALMGYLCEGGEYCPHGCESTHWVDDEDDDVLLEGYDDDDDVDCGYLCSFCPFEKDARNCEEYLSLAHDINESTDDRLRRVVNQGEAPAEDDLPF
jgi:hypothetical protein